LFRKKQQRSPEGGEPEAKLGGMKSGNENKVRKIQGQIFTEAQLWFEFEL
jgi:hypothetical protein